MILIVAGASGAGKSFLLEHLNMLEKKLIPIRKMTTRDKRPYEKNNSQYKYYDLNFDMTREDVISCDYVYHYGNDIYGINKSDIIKEIDKGLSPVVIIRDCETIKVLKNDFKDVYVLYLQSVLSGDDLNKKLRQLGRDDIDLADRMKRIEYDFKQYVKYNYLFDHVLINNFDKDDLIGQAREKIHEFQEKCEIVKKVFVIMPFSDKYKKIYEAMRFAVKLSNIENLDISRVDDESEKKIAYSITDKILKDIQQAGLIITDISESSANVYYELGFSWALNKNIKIIAKKDTNIPFDISNLSVTFYENPIDLQTKLIKFFQSHYNYCNQGFAMLIR